MFEIDLGQDVPIIPKTEPDTEGDIAMDLDPQPSSTATNTNSNTSTSNPTIKLDPDHSSTSLQKLRSDLALVSKLRTNTLHLTGVDNLSTEQVRKYVKTHGNVRRFQLEWVNDTSVNVNLFTPQAALQVIMLLAVSPPVHALQVPIPDPVLPHLMVSSKDPSNTASFFPESGNNGSTNSNNGNNINNNGIPAIKTEPQQQSQHLALQDLEDMRQSALAVQALVDAQYDVETAVKNGNLPNVESFFLTERRAVPLNSNTNNNGNGTEQDGKSGVEDKDNGPPLYVRYAVISDVKVHGARSQSRYYLIHGEPTLEDDLISFGSIRKYDPEERLKEGENEINGGGRGRGNSEEGENDTEDILSSKVLRRIESRSYKRNRNNLGVASTSNNDNGNNNNGNEEDGDDDNNAIRDNEHNGASRVGNDVSFGAPGQRNSNSLFDRIGVLPKDRRRGRGGRRGGIGNGDNEDEDDEDDGNFDKRQAGTRGTGRRDRRRRGRGNDGEDEFGRDREADFDAILEGEGDDNGNNRRRQRNRRGDRSRSRSRSHSPESRNYYRSDRYDSGGREGGRSSRNSRRDGYRDRYEDRRDDRRDDRRGGDERRDNNSYKQPHKRGGYPKTEDGRWVRGDLLDKQNQDNFNREKYGRDDFGHDTYDRNNYGRGESGSSSNTSNNNNGKEAGSSEYQSFADRLNISSGGNRRRQRNKATDHY